MLSLDERGNDFKEDAHVLTGLTLVLRDQLRLSTVDLEQSHDCLAIGQILLLHGAPDDEAFAQRISCNELVQLFLQARRVFDQDTVFFDNDILYRSADQVAALVDLDERHEAAEEDAELFNTHQT